MDIFFFCVCGVGIEGRRTSEKNHDVHACSSKFLVYLSLMMPNRFYAVEITLQDLFTFEFID